MDKGHCFMNTESFDEYAKFYDFSEQLKNLDQGFKKNSKFDEHEMEVISDDEDSEWSENEDDEEDE